MTRPAVLALDAEDRVVFLDGPLPCGCMPTPATAVVGRCLRDLCPDLAHGPLTAACRAARETAAPQTVHLDGAAGARRVTIHRRPDGLALYTEEAAAAAARPSGPAAAGPSAGPSAGPTVGIDRTHLGAVFDGMSDGVLVLDVEGSRISMNQAALRLHGFDSGDELRAAAPRFPQLFAVWDAHGRALPPADWPTARALRGERFSSVDLWVRRTDVDRTFYGSFSGAPVCDESGRIVLAVVTVRDATGRRQAEEDAARERSVVDMDRRRLRAVLDVLPFPMFIADHEGRLVLVNEKARVLWGEAPTLGMPKDYTAFRAWWAPTARPVAPEEWGLSRAIRYGEVCTAEEMDVETTRGERRTILNYALPVHDPDGRIVGGVAVNVDITDRRRMEQELRALNETLEQRVRDRTAIADRRLRQLRDLAGELALTEQRERRRVAQLLHDHLQQLLVAARLRIGMLRARLREAPGHAAVDQLDELLCQAVAASRSLTVELSPPVLHDVGLAAGLEWLVRHVHEKHGLVVDASVDPGVDVADEAVRTTVFEAARELLFNVVKHAGTNRARLTLERAGCDRVRVTIEDGGAGFDPATAQRTGARGGFGLFSIERRLELLGGEAAIASAPGHGTSVTLLAPLGVTPPPANGQTVGATAAVAPAGAAARTRAHGQTRVLIVDDHAIVREGLVNLLLDEPDILVVGEAEDGVQALDLTRSLHPDVVIMDVSMPRLNGIAATRRIRAELPDVRVVGLSMHEQADMAAAMVAAGAAAYLSKGGPAEALLAAIRER